MVWTILILLKIFVTKCKGSQSSLCIAGNQISQLSFNNIIKSLSISSLINIESATFQNNFWSSFDMDSFVVSILCLGSLLLWEFNDCWHSLSYWVKHKSHEVWWQIFISVCKIINSTSPSEFQHCLFGSICVINGSTGVTSNSLSDQIKCWLWFAELSSWWEVWSLNGFLCCLIIPIIVGIFNWFVTSTPDICQSHKIFGKSTSLIRANVIGTTHDFAWC